MLLKVNNIGTIQWAKTISSGYCYNYKGFYVQQTNDGGYITGDYVLNSTNPLIWLIKTIILSPYGLKHLETHMHYES